MKIGDIVLFCRSKDVPWHSNERAFPAIVTRVIDSQTLDMTVFPHNGSIGAVAASAVPFGDASTDYAHWEPR